MKINEPVKVDNTIPNIWHDSIIRQLEYEPHLAYRRKFVPLIKKGLLKRICIKFRIGKFVEEKVEFTLENRTVKIKKLDN